jgi:hypothetical protein
MSDIPTETIVRALREISADIYGTDPKPAKAVAAAATRLEELGRELALFAPVNGNRADTSLENWFPLTAEELLRLRRELAEANKYRDALANALMDARQALRIAKEEIEFDAAHSIVAANGERRVVSQALDAINAALTSGQGTQSENVGAKLK